MPTQHQGSGQTPIVPARTARAGRVVLDGLHQFKKTSGHLNLPRNAPRGVMPCEIVRVREVQSPCRYSRRIRMVQEIEEISAEFKCAIGGGELRDQGKVQLSYPGRCTCDPDRPGRRIESLANVEPREGLGTAAG